MKYELKSIDMRNYDVGWFKNSKITSGKPPPRVEITWSHDKPSKVEMGPFGYRLRC